MKVDAKGVRSVCVFCGSSPGNDPQFGHATAELAGRLAAAGVTLVTGGGGAGLMGVAADAALAAGGRVVGIIPERLMHRELAHKALTELHVVRSMHERKAKMAELSDAFVAAPGGIGTLEELFEVFTWKQIGYHDKPVVVLNVAGYYDPLIGFLEHAVARGLVQAQVYATLRVFATAAETADFLLAAEAPEVDFRANEEAT